MTDSLECIAQAAAALDVLGRRDLAVWLMRTHAALAAPAGCVVDERIVELANRLVASGPKAAHVSASECHEIRDFIVDLAAAGPQP